MRRCRFVAGIALAVGWGMERNRIMALFYRICEIFNEFNDGVDEVPQTVLPRWK